MTVQTHKRVDLAGNQLAVAIGLFMTGGDRFSVISLAGAADVILCQVVTNAGEENFTEHCAKLEAGSDKSARPREVVGREMNDTIFINHLKHMDEGEDGYISIDLEGCAVAAILKALTNFAIIFGRDSEIVQAFLKWVKENLDPEKYNVDCDPDWSAAT